MKNTRCLAAALAASLLAINLAAQDQKPPKPEITVVKVNGFRTIGEIANIVEGTADFVRANRPQSLKPQQILQKDDTVHAGNDSRIEFLLNPGIYVRMAANTSVTLLDLSRDNLKLRLQRGSIIIESVVLQSDQSSPSYDLIRSRLYGGPRSITVFTDGGDFVATTGGVYRCDVGLYRHSTLRVIKGLAVVAASIVGNQMEAVIGDRVPTVKKFDQTKEDAFDKWSRERAAALVASNRSLRSTSWHTQLRKNSESEIEILDPESSRMAKERLTVSALGGQIGFVENGVLRQSGDAPWEVLKEGDELQYGDRVKTGADGRAEIRLYPSCYLMVANESELLYDAREDGSAAPKLLKGSAIIASAIDRKEGLEITFVSPTAEVHLLEEGFYRLNVKPGRASEFLVITGRIKVGDKEVKQDKRIVFQGTEYEIWPIRKMDVDSFELWSRKRSATLIASSLLPRSLQGRPHGGGSRQMGLWYLDQTTGAYTFVPGFGYFSSPYGGRYAVGYGKWNR